MVCIGKICISYKKKKIKKDYTEIAMESGILKFIQGKVDRKINYNNFLKNRF